MWTYLLYFYFYIISENMIAFMFKIFAVSIMLVSGYSFSLQQHLLCPFIY